MGPGTPAADDTIGVVRAFRAIALLILLSACARDPKGPLLELTRPVPTPGVLRVSDRNPRYFQDSTGRTVYLAGSHTWSNLQDNGVTDPPERFDYTSYLDRLADLNHNFFRLWTWENAKWANQHDGDYWITPLPYARVGPATALDGKPKFDLTRWNDGFFSRMRERVEEAGRRGFYVAIVLFNGWSISRAKGKFAKNNPWRGHPFHRENNVNGVDGDLNRDDDGSETHTLASPEVLRTQLSYVRKVVETVHDLDNVLYEISNESPSGSEPWQARIMDEIRQVDARLGTSHPVGMTVCWPGGGKDPLYASTADWIALNGTDNPRKQPIVADGRKVLMGDTDHLCGICGDREWAWKAFLRGQNLLFMDGYDGRAIGLGAAGYDATDPAWEPLRRTLGYTVTLAQKYDLAELEPRPDLASTGYCLADRGSVPRLVYRPSPDGRIAVDLRNAKTSLAVEWLHPASGRMTTQQPVPGGQKQFMKPEFDGDAVLCLTPIDSR